jgi:hypothetical protein
MNLRKEIVERLNQPQISTNARDQFKSCFEYENSETHKLWDEWFESCMLTLFYRPQQKGLLICGKQGIGKTHMLRNFLPEKHWYGPTEYNHFVTEFEDHINPAVFKETIASDGFRIVHTPRLSAEKRLTNPVYTCNVVPKELQKKERILYMYISSIDWGLFNVIDKNLLWNEIFHAFLQKHGIYNIFLQDDINSVFG